MDVISQLPQRSAGAAWRWAVLGRAAIAGLFALALGTANADSAELKVVTGVEMARVLATLAPEIEKLTQSQLVIDTVAPGALKHRIEAGSRFDVAILVEPIAEALIEEGRLAVDGLSCIAWAQFGIAIRAGVAKPDIGTVDGLRRTLLSARSIAYDAESVSGAHFREMLRHLGIVDKVKAKLIATSGPGVIGLVARSEAELGVSLASLVASAPEVEALGPLPAELQSLPVFAARSADTSAPDRARLLIAFLSSFDAAPTIHGNGFDTAIAE